MSLLLIMNPGSRAGRGQRRWRQWETALQQASIDYQRAYTKHIGHAVELARAATAGDTVVAVGGDGTINEVLDGVMQSPQSDLRMGVLYAGTSPDFCRFHGIPIEPAKAVAALIGGTAQRVDVGRITYHDTAGRPVTAYFGCSCNIGLGAAIARSANRWRRYLGDVPGTAASLLRALWVNPRVDIAMVVDGNPLALSQVNNLTILKNPYLASGLRLQVDARRDDGLLYLVGITGRNCAGMFGIIPACYTGTVATAPGVLVQPCKTVQVYTRLLQEIEFDGDPRGFLPATIEVVPRGLWLVGGGPDA